MNITVIKAFDPHHFHQYPGKFILFDDGTLIYSNVYTHQNLLEFYVESLEEIQALCALESTTRLELSEKTKELEQDLVKSIIGAGNLDIECQVTTWCSTGYNINTPEPLRKPIIEALSAED